MESISQVKRIKHESDIKIINDLLEQGWILIEVFHSPAGIKFILGKV